MMKHVKGDIWKYDKHPNLDFIYMIEEGVLFISKMYGQLYCVYKKINDLDLLNPSKIYKQMIKSNKNDLIEFIFKDNINRS